jgi:hypothetical protein
MNRALNCPRLTILIRLLLMVAALSLASCGYVMSGQWEDDPKNWRRAFGSTKPDDVVVIHSKYWRSPHWTVEFGYCFKIQAHAGLRHQLFTKNRLERIDDADAARARSTCGPPSWFAPDPIEKYEAWTYLDPPADNNFIVLIDKKSGTMFLADCQI